MRVPAGMRQAAMDALPGLFLGLSTGALGDADEPIVLDDAGAAGPSGSGNRNLEPPTDSGLFAARRFDKCACLGVYTGTPMLSSDFDNPKEKIAKEYAYQLKTIDVEGTKLSFVIVPPYGADGKVDLRSRTTTRTRRPRCAPRWWRRTGW